MNKLVETTFQIRWVSGVSQTLTSSCRDNIVLLLVRKHCLPIGFHIDNAPTALGCFFEGGGKFAATGGIGISDALKVVRSRLIVTALQGYASGMQGSSSEDSRRPFQKRSFNGDSHQSNSFSTGCGVGDRIRR